MNNIKSIARMNLVAGWVADKSIQQMI